MPRRQLAVLLLLLLAGAGVTAAVAATRRGRPARPAAGTPVGTGTGAVTASPPPASPGGKATGSGSVRTPGAPLAIAGRVTGLAPGTPVRMALAIRNPNPFPVRVRTVMTSVGRPDRTPCPVRLLRVGTYDRPTVVPALSTVTVTVPAVLVDSVAEDQSGCPGATFPLTFGGTADVGR